MSVVVQCYHCNTILELDDGFRGGVCRCSSCGSLLQVPKASSSGTPKARPAAPGAAVTDVQRPADPNADPGLSRGQFDPRQQSGGRPAVSDFGGSSSGLRQARPGAPTATKIERVIPLSGPSQHIPHAREVRKNKLLLWAGIGLVAAIAIVVVVLLVKFVIIADHEGTHRGTGGGGDSTVQTGGSTDTGAPAIKGPQFLGIPLVGKKIVLSVDGASSMQDCFDFVRRACSQAADSLEPDQTLVVVLWSDSRLEKIPASGFVGKSSAATLREALDAVSYKGSSEARDCMVASLDIGGDQIIFITAKPDLPEDYAAAILAARKNGQRCDGIKIGSAESPSLFESLARQTNGKCIFMTQRQLERAVARP